LPYAKNSSALGFQTTTNNAGLEQFVNVGGAEFSPNNKLIQQ